jgi:NADH-ubiquinone oxidoreductase chain 6
MMLNIRIVEIISVGREYTKNLPLKRIVGSLFFFEILSIIPASTLSQPGGIIGVPLGLFNYFNGLLFSVQSASSIESQSNVHMAFTGLIPDDSFANFTTLVLR